MAILGKPGNQIEVRLAKPPFDTSEPVYFDEYEKLSDEPQTVFRCVRYIAAEESEYAIDITLKKDSIMAPVTRYMSASTMRPRTPNLEGSVLANDRLMKEPLSQIGNCG
jgi:hypothetical protein